ncbi:MAG TPA: 4-hydroxy-3-methylbut-2-enyl diphosphate reductase [Spirochaetota bacterium]|nr:4-hydroxy-3-methylbut-2-enyl diphosphate reductase [Spirochaetota bacterium]HOS33250.1 4-hydroxy-3-methylbut-2-enyl diphosphate reductase [Spirochaetota bacterium]HOS54833.1 4-hydroxy-3-methylbut-2-enyl diphosphate reductase [Spirochaetota bacterium]HPK63068.1 4-hydroxy-3-methylbut-2-enyl diphosphate reductase [Spirochaetota bacterium]HQF76788.1 4-hydroxy-3-methylbut-2-enyl diphosphate reductase [Spirochaetota bacterium]
MKKIIKSKKCGFCMGVKNAFTKSLDSLEKYKNVCCYGEIVHNRFALETLIERGIKIIADINEIINDDTIENVVVRAHGITPGEERLLRSNKNVIDLTCPNVKKIQIVAQKYSNDDYFVIILGKKDHPEVKGIAGYCSDKLLIIKNISEIKAIEDIYDKYDKIAFISQTTANPNDFDAIVEYFHKYYPKIEINNTLCKAPINIQNETISLAQKADVMLIIGDKKSANTTALFDISRSYCESYFIETINDLESINLERFETIGVSGGSSTPQKQIEDIEKYLNKKYP